MNDIENNAPKYKLDLSDVFMSRINMKIVFGNGMYCVAVTSNVKLIIISLEQESFGSIIQTYILETEKYEEILEVKLRKHNC